MMVYHAEIVIRCPYMVSINQNVRGRQRLCGGTVLSQTLTLTAAHCVIYGLIGLTLQFGSIHMLSGKLFQATKIIFHEHFDKVTLAHDLGVISIFPALVKFGYNIQPVILPRKKINFNSQTKIKIFGWGAVSENKTFSEILRSAKLPIIDRRICKALLEGMLPPNTFCLGYFDGHTDACLGDSGGPAMLDGVQVGITSFGEGCAEPLKPGVYTDLRKYVNWLTVVKETIQ